MRMKNRDNKLVFKEKNFLLHRKRKNLSPNNRCHCGSNCCCYTPTRMAKEKGFIVLALFLIFSLIMPSSTIAKSRRPITDIEMRQKKNQCYEDIESGLWGWQCKSSMIAKENCVLKCLSPTCYQIIYQPDPLEEGEKDLIRGQEYKYCMHKLSLGESLEGIKSSFE
ncbi:hypothetical protein F8388_025038 [Cannabis sativa]|uniref:Uncharacterized protein n=2 Tax=Cannabis sativa TaxID=3483 RepID=A0A7J6G3X1_CANSA|nr:hypothetical protein F8388_025038 [Cannabis sativa]